MKNILVPVIIFLWCLCFTPALAQNDLGAADDLARISLTPVVPDQVEGLPSSAHSQLKTKLQQIATTHGLGGTNLNPRFIITSDISVLEKDIVPSAPPKVMIELEFIFYIADYEQRGVFSTTNLTAKGIGSTDAKAYIQAIRKIKPQASVFETFVSQGKKKIIEYYNSRCHNIQAEAAALAGQYKFEEAIYVLSSVPEVCQDCYLQCMESIPAIYGQYLDRLCEQNLAQAKAVWVANPNSPGANQVAQYLGQITPDAKCYGEAQQLVDEIRKEVKDDENKEWDFQLKQWDDKVSLEEQRIWNWRHLGWRWYRRRPATSYDLGWIRR